MIPTYKIERLEKNKYIIKRKNGFPLYEYMTMSKAEFFGDLNPYGFDKLADKYATFRNIEDVYDALQQHAQINGYTEVIVKRKL
jgi:hypothetical protein